MIFNRLPDEVEILRATSTTDEYGNSVKAVDPYLVETTRGFLQAERGGGGGESITAERNSVSSLFRLYLPAVTEISARDQVRISGSTYTVEGEPTAARGLNGTSHLQARLRKLEG